MASHAFDGGFAAQSPRLVLSLSFFTLPFATARFVCLILAGPLMPLLTVLHPL